MLTDVQAHTGHTGRSHPHSPAPRDLRTHRYTRERRHSRQAEINSQAGKDPHVPDDGLPPESPNAAFSTAAAGAQWQGTGEGRAAGRQAGWVSPTEGGGESPSGPRRSPKCTEEGVGRSGSSLGSLPPSKRGGPWRLGTGGGHRGRYRGGAQKEGPVLLCRWSSCAGTPSRTSRLTGKKLTRIQWVIHPKP